MKHFTVFQQGKKKGKKDKRRFHYLSKKQFKSLVDISKEHPNEIEEPTLIGGTSLKAYDDEKARQSNKKQCDFIVELNGFKYKGFKKKHGITKGYFDVGDGDYVVYKTWFPIILLFFIGLATTALLLMPYLQTPVEPTPPIPTFSGDEWNGDLPTSAPDNDYRTEYTEFQGYTKYYITAEAPNLPLVNARENTVYLQYTVLDGQDVLFVSQQIPPGYAENWNAYEALGEGEHTITLNVSSTDVETGEPCTGTTQETTLIVTGD